MEVTDVSGVPTRKPGASQLSEPLSGHSRSMTALTSATVAGTATVYRSGRALRGPAAADRTALAARLFLPANRAHAHQDRHHQRDAERDEHSDVRLRQPAADRDAGQ